MYSRACFGKDTKRAAAIMEKTDPSVIKRIGEAVKIDHTAWKARGLQAMEEALTAKFTQNDHLKDYLLNTEQKVLVECTRNKLWGCGFHLHSKEAAVRSKWSGENMLGVLLSQVRSNLKPPQKPTAEIWEEDDK